MQESLQKAIDCCIERDILKDILLKEPHFSWSCAFTIQFILDKFDEEEKVGQLNQDRSSPVE